MSVIDLTTKTRLEPKRSPRYCRCAQVYVVEQTRMLECQHCGKVIEPFDFIWKQACEQNNAAFKIQSKRDEIKRLSEEVEELKRVKRNLKAQVRRAESK